MGAHSITYSQHDDDTNGRANSPGAEGMIQADAYRDMERALYSVQKYPRRFFCAWITYYQARSTDLDYNMTALEHTPQLAPHFQILFKRRQHELLVLFQPGQLPSPSHKGLALLNVHCLCRHLRGPVWPPGQGQPGRKPGVVCSRGINHLAVSKWCIKPLVCCTYHADDSARILWRVCMGREPTSRQGQPFISSLP